MSSFSISWAQLTNGDNAMKRVARIQLSGILSSNEMLYACAIDAFYPFYPILSIFYPYFPLSYETAWLPGQR